jgi:hypothetical protein
MATMPPKTPHHRPPPAGPQGRGHVSPLGGHTVKDGGQILRGGGSSGPLIRKPLEVGHTGEKPILRRGMTVPIVS